MTGRKVKRTRVLLKEFLWNMHALCPDHLIEFPFVGPCSDLSGSPFGWKRVAPGAWYMVPRMRLLSRNLMEIRVRSLLEGELKPDADKGALRKADANTPVSWASQE
ncbi:hypothetical protein CSAL01_10022 [Colletotrichum salicis]|uniref:Uncharacterized protein n=1 Tax=Colletotrichum salicis TaxID=1209931 RepID=A0A135THK8_9PEZI|nr:hypothetical protein CSAL01_10022 [Colletotrichum salicis]